MFIMQSFSCSFCFNEIRTLIQWSLNTFFIQLEYPIFLVASSFLCRCNFGVAFQCKFVILNNFAPQVHLISDKDLRYGSSFVPPLQNSFVTTMLGLASFLQLLPGFVVHSLPLGSSMFGTMVEVLFDDVTGN